MSDELTSGHGDDWSIAAPARGPRRSSGSCPLSLKRISSLGMSPPPPTRRSCGRQWPGAGEHWALRPIRNEVTDGLGVARGKTDQEAVGREVGIPWGQHPETCPIRALRAWREAAGIADGPLFRAVNRHDQVRGARLTDQSVARIVKRAAMRVGLDPARYAEHSLRAGLATAAAAGGASGSAIMKQTGHRSVEMVRRYIRSGSLFHENSAAYVGL